MIDLHVRTSSWWERFMARLFGKKIVAVDGDYQITVYRWRNTFHVTDFSILDERDRP